MLTASFTNVTVAFPQPSETVTLATFGAGIVALHPVKFTIAGQEITGGLLSMVRVIVCVQIAALPQASRAP